MPFESNHDLTGFNMIYHSTQSDDYLWYLVLRGKKLKNTRIQNSNFNGRNKNSILCGFCSVFCSNGIFLIISNNRSNIQ